MQRLLVLLAMVTLASVVEAANTNGNGFNIPWRKNADSAHVPVIWKVLMRKLVQTPSPPSYPLPGYPGPSYPPPATYPPTYPPPPYPPPPYPPPPYPSPSVSPSPPQPVDIIPAPQPVYPPSPSPPGPPSPTPPASPYPTSPPPPTETSSRPPGSQYFSTPATADLQVDDSSCKAIAGNSIPFQYQFAVTTAAAWGAANAAAPSVQIKNGDVAIASVKPSCGSRRFRNLLQGSTVSLTYAVNMPSGGTLQAAEEAGTAFQSSADSAYTQGQFASNFGVSRSATQVSSPVLMTAPQDDSSSVNIGLAVGLSLGLGIPIILGGVWAWRRYSKQRRFDGSQYQRSDMEFSRF